MRVGPDIPRLAPLAASIAVLLLSLGVAACGGASKIEGPKTHVRSAGAVTGGSGGKRPPATPADSRSQSYLSFGHKAGEAEARVITAIVTKYFAAVVADDGKRACSLLYSPLASSVPEDYGKGPAGPPEWRGATCPAVMSLVFKHRRGQPTSDVADIKVIGVRVSAGQATALLRSSTMRLGEIGLLNNRGTWQIVQLLGAPLA